MKKHHFIALLFISLLALNKSIAQVVLKEIPSYNYNSDDSLFLGKSAMREIKSLNGDWKAFFISDTNKRFDVAVPSAFNGKGNIVFEKEIIFSRDEIEQKKIKLVMLGMSYSAEISINGLLLYKHNGGEYPLEYELPWDLLKADSKNILSIKIDCVLDSKTSIPSNKRFLFPENFSGLFRDVYLTFSSKALLSDLNYSYKFNESLTNAKFSINANVVNELRINKENSETSSFFVKFQLLSPDGGLTTAEVPLFELNRNKDKRISVEIDVKNPILWSPEFPKLYELKAQLFDKNKKPLDEIKRKIPAYSFSSTKDSIVLNGRSLILKGTTYYSSYGSYGALADYNTMKADMNKIKETGFNSVRFAKAAPHPYLLKICEEIGLLAFCEIPINSLPEEIIVENNFSVIAKNYLMNFLSSYKKFASFSALGLGGSYLSDSEVYDEFLTDLAAAARNNFDKLIYASFIGYDLIEVEGIDLYGIELINKPMRYFDRMSKDAIKEFGKGKIFLSETIYANYEGVANGYLTPYSHEACAKIYSDVIDSVNKAKIGGFFFNSIFDYRGDYHSLLFGYNKNYVYRLGIFGEDRSPKGIIYKAVYSKLNDLEKVTIPPGAKKEDSPLIFIFFGLGVGLFMGVLINARKKLRENSTRALLRPYNFFADVRDQRILSNFHSNFLMLIFAASMALTAANLLFYFRGNFLIDKILIAFNSPKLLEWTAYLMYHPKESLVVFTFIAAVKIIFISFIIKAFSLLIKNKVYYSSIYYMTIWSFLPMALLLPLGLVLYKILVINAVNEFIYIALLLFGIWTLHRLLKGVYVVFDANPKKVYIVAFLFIIALCGGFLAYMQITESFLYYAANAYKQYKLL